MSAASQWKLKKEAAAAAAAASTSKTGIPEAKGKTEASAKDVSGGGAVSGPLGFKGQMEISGKQETAKPGPPQSNKFGPPQASKPGPPPANKPGPPQANKPGPPQASKPESPYGISFGKQGVSKLPVGKDTVKTREADTKDGSVQPFGATPSSKIPLGAKENIANVGGRKPFGAGLKKEEPAPAVRSKAEDNKVKTTELKKDPAGGDKDPTAAATAAEDDGPLGPGRTKGLAGFWANQNDEVKTVKKKRLTAVEDNLTPMVVENTPQQLEGVVRAVDPGEWKKPLEMEDGWTKNVVSSFQKRQQESFSRRAPISLVEDTSSEKSDTAPDAEAAKVKVKDISQRLTRQQSEPTKQAKEKLVIDRSQGAIVLAENQPMEVDPDVVRSDDASKEEVVLEKGRTKNLLALWKNTEVEYNAPKTSTHRYQGSKPAWILEIEAAKGNSIDKNDEGQPEENNMMEMNDESGKSATHYEERVSIAAATKHADDDKQNIVLGIKARVPLPKEAENAGVPLQKRSRDVEAIQSLKPRTDETNIIKLEGNHGTINKEIPCAVTPTTPSVAIVSQVQVAEVLPDPVPNDVEITKTPLKTQLAGEILTEEARSETPFDETNRKYEVCQQVNEIKPLEGKQVPKILPEETKPDSEVFHEVSSSFPDQNKTLQESSESEKEVQKLSSKESAPIHKASEKDDQQNELASKQQKLLSESSSKTLDKEEPSEQVHAGARPLPSTEIKTNNSAPDVPCSDAALNLSDAFYVGLQSENEVALGRNEVVISGTGDVEPMQRDDQSARNISDETSSRLTDDHASNLSSIQNTVSLPQGFLDQRGKPVGDPHRVPEDAVKIQPETNPVCEENKVAMTLDDHEESSDNETFSTPTKSVILSPLGSVVIAKQVEPCDTETSERTENAGKPANEPNFTEGTLIDLQTESTETRPEKLSLFSLDDLLQLETSPSVDHSSADNTPCLVPLSSPSTPEVNISSGRSSGVFDSDSEKCSDWFSPQEETTVTPAKTETISTHDDYSSGSPKNKAGDGNTTENKVDPTNKAEAPQRSCRLM